MRIIAGEWRSRVLHAPAGSKTRPTSDRLRETLFNVLGPRIEAARVADLFAGSGAVGLEALSRGAAHCTFVENARPALEALRRNLTSLGAAANRVSVVSGTVASALSGARAGRAGGNAELADSRKWDVVFLDPPYENAEAYRATLAALSRQWLAEDAVVVAEHAAPGSRKGVADLPETVETLTRTRLLVQGDAALSFFRRASSDLNLSGQ